MGAIGGKRSVSLMRVTIPRFELLRALAAGDLIAEGRYTVAGYQWKPTGNPRIGSTRLPFGPLHPRGPIGCEWWQAVDLEVELHWPGWVLTRDSEDRTEFILQIEVLKKDIERLWLGRNYFDPEEPEVANENDSANVAPVSRDKLFKFVFSVADGAKTKPQLEKLARENFKDRKITIREFAAAYDALPADKKRRQGQRDHTSRPDVAG